MFFLFLFLATYKCATSNLRRQDSSIGFGAPVRANMRSTGVTTAAVTSSLLETVSSLQLLVYAYIHKKNQSFLSHAARYDRCILYEPPSFAG